MGFFSSLVSGIGSVVSGIGGFLGNAINSFIGGLGSFVSPVFSGILLASKVLGLVKGNEQQESLQMYQGYLNGIRREDFNSFEEYMDNLPEVDSSEYTDEQKLDATGLYYYTLKNELDTNVGNNLPVSTYVFVDRLGDNVEANPKNLQLISSMIDKNSITIDKIEKYKSRELDSYEKEKLESAVGEIISKLELSDSIEDIEKFIDGLGDE